MGPKHGCFPFGCPLTNQARLNHFAKCSRDEIGGHRFCQMIPCRIQEVDMQIQRTFHGCLQSVSATGLASLSRRYQVTSTSHWLLLLRRAPQWVPIADEAFSKAAQGCHVTAECDSWQESSPAVHTCIALRMSFNEYVTSAQRQQWKANPPNTIAVCKNF